MKVILFWLAIVFTSLAPSYILASDNPHMETCVRIVNANKDSSDSINTPRFNRLPDNQLAHVPNHYTERELKTSVCR